MEDKGYFSRLVCIDSYSDSSNENVLPLMAQRWFLSHRKFYDLLLGRKGRSERLLASVVSQASSTQSNQYAKVAYLGVAYSEPLHM